MGRYPRVRLRRLRELPALRRMARETRLSVSDFVYPIFVTHGRGVRRAIDPMPGIHQLSLDHVIAEVGEVAEQRGDVTVKSEIVGGQFDGATIDYRSRVKDGEWLVIDVIIEGVSLVSNFRSQFKPIVAQGGAAELLARLKDKNDILQKEIVPDEKE